MENTYGTFIVNPANELLICRPYGIKDKTGWTIPKGKMEKGETPIMAAMRECFEETGFSLKAYQDGMIFIGSKTYKTKKKRLHGWFLKLNCDIKIDFFFCDSKVVGKNVPEIDKYEWCDIKTSYGRIHEAQARLFEDYVNADGV